MEKKNLMVASVVRLLVAVVVVALMSGPVWAVPVSDGSLFDDIGSTDLSKWKTVAGNAWYEASVGNPAGSIEVQTGTGTEGFLRPNMYWANHGETEWVTEFDVKLSEVDSSGDGFLLYAAYAPNFASAIDIEIGVATHDYVYNYYGTDHNAWDIHVYDGAGYSGLTLRLDAQLWHHFTVHRTVATGVVDLYINGNLEKSYQAMNPAEILGEVQIGDVSGGAMWGHGNWDNFSIGVPEPATMMLLSVGCVALLRRRVK